MKHATTVSWWMGRDVERRLVAAWRGGSVGVLAVLAVLLLPLGVKALGPGALDISFSGDGKVLTDFRSGHANESYARALALQPDGKIVVAGDSLGNDNFDFALARYLPNGTLDATFGDDGKVTTDFSDNMDEAYALALQPDGKIVVAGSALARYNANGTLDTTFSGDGMVLLDFPALALALQPDGKIVVVGLADTSGTSDFALARYRPDGTLDTTFSSDGKVLTTFGSVSGDWAWAVALQPDGKIVVVGGSNAGGSPDFPDMALARYLSDGTLDATFGSDGKVLTDLGGRDHAYAVVLQPDGKIVVAGYSDAIDGSFDFALARYNANGTLDTTFGGDGTVLTTFGSGFEEARALALQPDGRIVVAGFASTTCQGAYSQDFALARYNANGTLDTTFGGDGTVLTAFGCGSEEESYALALQPRDGRLVVAGYSLASGSGATFALARYHAITCGGVVVTRIGTAGNDTLVGTDGPDVIFGFGGHDTIYGLGGNDILCGGSGNDTLYGGSGNDMLRGDSGNDTINGGTGDDTLLGDTGTDVCNGEGHVSRDMAQSCERVTGVP